MRATRSSDSVSGSVAITIAARFGPASSRGPCRNCADSSASAGKPTASFRVRAAISAAARAGPRPSTTTSSRGPSHARRSSPSASFARSRSIEAAARSASPDSASHAALGCRPLAGPSRSRRARRAPPPNVAVDGPVSSPARVSSTRSAVRARVLSVPFVTATIEGASSRSPKRLREMDDLRALARLAHRDHRRRRAEDPRAEVEELRGPEHHGRETGLGEVGGERVAGGVGAAHPREDHGAVRDEAGQRSGACSRWSRRPAAARRSASGCPAISAEKGSGKFPNDFTAAVYDAVPWV